MTTYSISPDLFKRNNFNDEFDDWMGSCFKSKWDNRDNRRDEEDSDEPFDPDVLKQD
jgi:hypothetical protein